MIEGTQSGTTELTGLGHNHSSATINVPIHYKSPHLYNTTPSKLKTYLSSPLLVAQKGKARPIHGKFVKGNSVNKVIVFCNICGKTKNETRTGRLVRDHNHQTGYIRGVLCDDCNQYLGIYESIYDNSIHILKARRQIGYITWVTLFKHRIEYHLKCNTGIKYDLRKKIPLEILVH